MKHNVEILHDLIQGMAADAEDKGEDSFVVKLTQEDAMSICKGLNGLIHCQNEMNIVCEDPSWRSPYHSTVDGMLSADYKERFKAEYQQTKIRYEKLKAFCNRIEAAIRTCSADTKPVPMPEHDCPLDLLRDQQRAMGEYLHCLEIRAVIEDVLL